MKIYISLILFVWSILSNAQTLENYVELWNGTILPAKTIEIIDPDKPECHLLINSNQPVAIKLVNNFQLNTVFFLVRDLGDKKSTILERIEHGKIDVYEFQKTYFDSRALSGGYHSNKYTYYVMNGEMKPLLNEFIKKDLQEYPDYYARIKSQKKRNLIYTGMILGGVCLTAVGVGDMFEKDGNNVPRFNFSPNGPFLIGIGLVVAPIINSKRKKESIIQIIRDFNLEYQ